MILRANRVLAVAAWFCSASVVAAGPTHEPSPVARAAQSVGSNLEKKPGNKGLQNAAERLQENRLRFDSKHETKTNKGQSSRVTGTDANQPAKPAAIDQPMKTEPVQRPERAERTERVERPERPEHIERAEKPGRPEKPEKPGRPQG